MHSWLTDHMDMATSAPKAAALVVSLAAAFESRGLFETNRAQFVIAV